MKEKILTENLNEYYDLAQESLNKKKYNSAATLFFKAICAAVDLLILKREGVVPSSHSERFRIIQSKYPIIYQIIDRDFPFYQDSYTQKINLEAVELLQQDAKRIRKMLKDGTER